MGNCYTCKYREIFITDYCAKQNCKTIVNLDAECPYYKQAFIYKFFKEKPIKYTKNITG